MKPRAKGFDIARSSRYLGRQYAASREQAMADFKAAWERKP
jgi:hypothetical protein